MTASDASVMFLTVQDVLRFQLRTVERHGGSYGVRDLALLDSAVAMPQQTFGGERLHEDLAAMAAAYFFHICSNHPFVDGNKRAGVGACLLFLAANGHTLATDNTTLTSVTLAVARGDLDKVPLTSWVRDRLARNDDERD